MLRRLLAAAAAALALHAPARTADRIEVGGMRVDSGALAFLLSLHTAYAGSAFLRELQIPGHGEGDDASR